MIDRNVLIICKWFLNNFFCRSALFFDDIYPYKRMLQLNYGNFWIAKFIWFFWDHVTMVSILCLSIFRWYFFLNINIAALHNNDRWSRLISTTHRYRYVRLFFYYMSVMFKNFFKNYHTNRFDWIIWHGYRFQYFFVVVFNRFLSILNQKLSDIFFNPFTRHK